jgi:CubicO group peptidase (beta-lactamase class C family)
MPVTPTRRTRLRAWTLLVLAAALAWLLFRLFEPVFTWSSGWQPLPAGDPAATGVVEPDWMQVGAAADRQLAQARQRLQTPALSAAVMVDGRRVWASAVGLADIAAGRAVDLDTQFRLGSTSKAINALAAGVLIDAGRLELDRSVRGPLPDLPAHYQPVTFRQAISHTAGVPDYGLCLCFPVWEHRNRRHFAGVRDALRVFEQRPLLFAPGTDFRYSSYGANLSGAAIEALAGQEYTAFVADAVFRPLGMRHSGADRVGAAAANRAAFYEVSEGSYKLADPVDNSIRYPSGGLVSTPSDMLAAGHAFLGHGVVSPATVALLLTPQPLAHGRANPQGYALGIRVANDKRLFDGEVVTTLYSHHGTAVGSTSYFAVYPEYGLVISLLMNTGQDGIDAFVAEANPLVELFVGELRARQALAAAHAPGGP